MNEYNFGNATFHVCLLHDELYHGFCFSHLDYNIHNISAITKLIHFSIICIELHTTYKNKNRLCYTILEHHNGKLSMDNLPIIPMKILFTGLVAPKTRSAVLL